MFSPLHLYIFYYICILIHMDMRSVIIGTLHLNLGIFGDQVFLVAIVIIIRLQYKDGYFFFFGGVVCPPKHDIV